MYSGFYAVTINNSQGSDYAVVILPIFMQYYLMLSRNLIYTWFTRAKQLAILLGTKKAISFAIQQVNNQQRYTLIGRSGNWSLD